MAVVQDGEIRIQSESDLVTVRTVVRDLATQLGFGITDVTRIVTASSELARNIYIYAQSGVVRWRIVSKDGRAGVELAFEDHGPGIADAEQAMQPGYSSGKGLGLGLPGAKRLMDELELLSEVNVGTTVIVRKYLRG